MHRRHFIARSGAALASLHALPTVAADFAPLPGPARIRATPDRIIDVAACTRPFRAQGPRIEAQQMGAQVVVHNYGHGGSGWSLSWGSAHAAVALALATRERRLGVIGCGAIGLTTARVAQQAGLRVRIYCRERAPQVQSAAATGLWSPDSRICTDEHATPLFQRQWTAMAARSFRTFQSLLGLPGDPVAWFDGYLLSDTPFGQPQPVDPNAPPDPEPAYAELDALLGEYRPRSVALTAAQHPFPVPHARRYTQMLFNLPAYSKLLMDEFMRDGGDIVQRTFTHRRQFASLPERTLVNATGYGARALLGDDSLVPVRGQTARLAPQPEVNYGLIWRGHNLVVVPRRDGILVQGQSHDDWNNADATPDRAASVAAVQRLALLYAA